MIQKKFGRYIVRSYDLARRFCFITRKRRPFDWQFYFF